MQLLPPAVIFAGQYGELRALPPNLAEEEAGKGMVETTDRRSNKGRRGMDGGGKTGSVIHPSNFSAVIAPMHWGLL